MICEAAVFHIELPVPDDFLFEPVMVQFELLFQKPLKARSLPTTAPSDPSHPAAAPRSGSPPPCGADMTPTACARRATARLCRCGCAWRRVWGLGFGKAKALTAARGAGCWLNVARLAQGRRLVASDKSVGGRREAQWGGGATCGVCRHGRRWPGSLLAYRDKSSCWLMHDVVIGCRVLSCCRRLLRVATHQWRHHPSAVGGHGHCHLTFDDMHTCIVEACELPPSLAVPAPPLPAA